MLGKRIGRKSLWQKLVGVRLVVLAALVLVALPAQAQNRFVVRDTLGQAALKQSCVLLGCSVQYGLGDPSGQLFLVTTPSTVDPVRFLLTILSQLGVTNAEVDQVVGTLAATAGPAPDSLVDETPVSYYGATVWRGYVQQPANQLVRTADTQSGFNVQGAGAIVAIIDTGVDTQSTVLQGLLVDGYDFTRNVQGGSEMADVTQSTRAVLDQAEPILVNQSTRAVLDQSTMAVVDDPAHAAFGHGTMTAGIVHLVAPGAKIMPLKAFNSAGSGYSSDILRALYYAVNHNAKVINMSFSYTSSSPELVNAINNAAKKNVILVASAGNDGQQVVVYPGGLQNVIDVASTSDQDVQSSFTNYGAPPVWLAAPGEGIVTLYPFGTYAAGWGTSFSAPFVSGTAALLVNVNAGCNQSKATSALANADPIGNYGLGNGRLDTYLAVQAWRTALGLQ